MNSPADPAVFQLGPLEIRWYGLLVVVGVLAAAGIATLQAKRRREEPDHVWNLTFWVLIFGLIGARLYHILSSPAGSSRGFAYYFIDHPFVNLTLFGVTVPMPTALLIWQGGLGLLGALLGGVLAVIVYCRRHQLNPWRWLDIAAPGALLAEAIGRWGHYFNQELYGYPTDLPWAILITNVNQRIPPYNNLTEYPLDTTFHPVFLYASLWSLVGLGLLWWLQHRYTARLQEGDLFLLYVMWVGLGRLWQESLRPDAWLIGGVAVAQVISLGLIAAALGWGFYRRHF